MALGFKGEAVCRDGGMGGTTAKLGKGDPGSISEHGPLLVYWSFLEVLSPSPALVLRDTLLSLALIFHSSFLSIFPKLLTVPWEVF